VRLRRRKGWRKIERRIPASPDPPCMLIRAALAGLEAQSVVEGKNVSGAGIRHAGVFREVNRCFPGGRGARLAPGRFG
jgi:hypothetical protein